ncbi:MAG: TRM11 family SAM-dependent methyltransferase [Anaerolineae bacterium]
MMSRDSDAAPYVRLLKSQFLARLDGCLEASDAATLRQGVEALRDWVELVEVHYADRTPGLLVEAASQDPVLSLRRDVLLEEIEQILTARTVRRAKYYLNRMRKAATEVRTSAINDINLNRWKEYDEIQTDSLWVVSRRDTSGAHEAWYWGNFIPQIPRQMMLRYTKVGDWVLDPFAGSGTTLIECRRLGRNGLGVELNPEVAQRAREVLAQEPNPQSVTTEIVTGDSRTIDFKQLLADLGIERVQFLMLHPPYHDIIKFSAVEEDLSNAPTVGSFKEQFCDIVDHAAEVLAPERFLAVVIGDKYQDGEWVPLGFEVMDSIRDRGFTLKSIVVKNFDGTRAKREQRALWRFRALAGGFYVFKHEYIFIFQA